MLSRAALGRGVCEREDWRNGKGEYCTASARKALPELAAHLKLPLPPPQPGPPAGRVRCSPSADVETTVCSGSLEELGEVRVQLASSEADRRLCAELLDAQHPLGAGRAPGCRLSYLLAAECGPLIEAVAEAEGLRPPGERGQPPGADIRSWVVLLARLRGWRPKKRRELPGNEVLWKAYQQLQTMVRYRQTLRGPAP